MLAYFAATIVFGALTAPWLYWAGQSLAARGIFPALAQFEFESFFHRALILGALTFLWPFLRSLEVKRPSDLGLERNRRWARDLIIGFLLSTVPVVLCEIVLVQSGAYSLRSSVPWDGLLKALGASMVVPLIEETLFRGLFLGVLLRSLRPWPANTVKTLAPKAVSPKKCWSGRQSSSPGTGGISTKRRAAHLIAEEGIESREDG